MIEPHGAMQGVHIVRLARTRHTGISWPADS